jgi:hypothetical protein
VTVHVADDIGLATIVGGRESRLPAFVEKASLLPWRQSWQAKQSVIMVA